MYGPCTFAAGHEKENTDSTKYVERCCLSPKEYTLTCRDSQKRGWQGGYIEIQGHKHCQDFFVGYTARRKLTVLGGDLNFRIQFLLWNITLYTLYTSLSIWSFWWFFVLGCNVGGNAGDGTAQGTCSYDYQLCEADGTCSGTQCYPKHHNNDGCYYLIHIIF